MHGTVMTLHEHLADTCSTTEVTIDLERRMGIEEVGVGAAARSPFDRVGNECQHVLDDLIGMVTVEHTCPEVRFPTETPTCGHITTLFQGVGSCREQFGVGVRRNLIRGIESIEV